MDEDQPNPGVYVLQRGDAVAVFLAPGVDADDINRDELGAYFQGVTFHFIEGVMGVTVRSR